MTPEEEDRIRQIISEELANRNMQSSNNKTKRTPSKWQLHLKECIPKQDKGLSMGDKVKACSVDYKKLKELNIEK